MDKKHSENHHSVFVINPPFSILSFFDASEMPRAYEHMGLHVSRRVSAVMVQLFGTKAGLLDFEAFLMSLTQLIKYSNRWTKTKEYAAGD